MAILPAGSFNTSKRTFTAFKVGDVVEGGVERVTRGLWSGNVGTLSTFFTSSAQSAVQKQYYYEVFDGVSTDETSEAQFSLAYGHILGSGSLGVNFDSPTKALYSQYAQILLPDTQRVFKFNNVATEHIYVLNINRARLKDRLDPGNVQINLSTLTSGGSVDMGGAVISLIDDSGDVAQTSNQIGRSYNLVSGSIVNGVHSPKTYFGKVFPEQGVIVFNADTLDSELTFTTNQSPNTNGDNAFKLFTSIKGSSDIDPDNGIAARNEEKVQSTYYFVRAKNGEYNFSNNPSFVTGSTGIFRQPTFINNPKTYITTVGLYNNEQEMLAVAKLSKPQLKSFSNELLIKAKLDF